jgi:hypothetical protein
MSIEDVQVISSRRHHAHALCSAIPNLHFGHETQTLHSCCIDNCCVSQMLVQKLGVDASASEVQKVQCAKRNSQTKTKY